MIKSIKNRIKKFLAPGQPHLHKRNNLQLAINFVIANNIEGDYLEYGVFKGESFILAFQTYQRTFERYAKMNADRDNIPFLDWNARFFAFDSFEGLPDTDDPDVPLHWTGDSPMSYPKYLFQQNLKKAGVDLSRVHMIEGYYEDSLVPGLYDQMNLKKAAIIHIDCDLYESTQTVLNTIRPLVQDGTVIIFDDYFYYRGSPYKGERGAFNEWLNEHKDIVVTELCKFYPAAAFILNVKKDSDPSFPIIV